MHHFYHFALLILGIFEIKNGLKLFHMILSDYSGLAADVQLRDNF